MNEARPRLKGSPEEIAALRERNATAYAAATGSLPKVDVEREVDTQLLDELIKMEEQPRVIEEPEQVLPVKVIDEYQNTSVPIPELLRMADVVDYKRRMEEGEMEALRQAKADLLNEQTMHKILNGLDAKKEEREKRSSRRARIIEVVQGAGGKLAEILNKEYKDPPKTF